LLPCPRPFLPEILPTLRALEVQSCWLGAHKSVQVGQLQGPPNVLLRVTAKGVQVHTQGPREQDGILSVQQSLTEKQLRPQA
jgi:hypothetical protein